MWFNRSIIKINTTLQLLNIISCRHVQHAKNLDDLLFFFVSEKMKIVTETYKC